MDVCFVICALPLARKSLLYYDLVAPSALTIRWVGGWVFIISNEDGKVKENTRVGKKKKVLQSTLQSGKIIR